MKIITICRTLNEAANIDRFCQSYQWADAILIADGGSKDKTIKLARRYPNVTVKVFRERIFQGDAWRNPHGKHINFMIDWAVQNKADWIIFDDCDCVPTQSLQRQARRILEATDKRVIKLYRLYVYGQTQYFPELNEPGKSLYAWRASVPVRAVEDEAWGSHCITQSWGDDDVLELEKPLTCLHYYCPDEATVKRKIDFYSQNGDAVNHPLTYSGRLEILPEWAKV